MTSLVQQCLESLGTYSMGPVSEGYRSKYTAEDGAYLIEMESAEALNEIYAINYLCECDLVGALMAAKKTGVPASEALESASVMESVADKFKAMYKKAVDMIKKIKEKLKAWFDNVKRFFAQFLMAPEKYVVKYQKQIEAGAKASGWATGLLIFKYDDAMFKKVVDAIESVGKEFSADARKMIVDQAKTKQSGNDEEYGSEAGITAGSMDQFSLQFKTKLGAKVDADDTALGKVVADALRGGSSDESAKVPVSGDIKTYIDLVKNGKKIITDFDRMNKGVQSNLDEFIKACDAANKEPYDTTALTMASKAAKTVQTAATSVASAYSTVAKERAGAAYALCKRAANYANKAAKEQNK